MASEEVVNDRGVEPLYIASLTADQMADGWAFFVPGYAGRTVWQFFEARSPYS